MRPYVLDEVTWRTVRDTRYDIALLPWGATEAHNYHLPYGTDTVHATHVATEGARIAWESGVRAVVLPAIPYGVNTGQLDIPLCINANPSTQAALLADIARSLDGHEMRALLIVNGHGGNDFRQMIRELQPQVRLMLCTVNWYGAADAGRFFTDPGDHAGELETSVMLHIAPDRVRPLTEAGDGRARKFRLRAMREGWVWTPRRWTEVTADTGVGNPAAATAEKGERFVHVAAQRLGEFLVELAAVEDGQLYES